MALVKQKHYAVSRCYVTNKRTTASFTSEKIMLCNRAVIYYINHLYEMALFVIKRKGFFFSNATTCPLRLRGLTTKVHIDYSSRVGRIDFFRAKTKLFHYSGIIRRENPYSSSIPSIYHSFVTNSVDIRLN